MDRFGWVLMPGSGLRAELMADGKWRATDGDGEPAPAVARTLNAAYPPSGGPADGDPRRAAILRLARAVAGAYEVEVPPAGGLVVY